MSSTQEQEQGATSSNEESSDVATMRARAGSKRQLMTHDKDGKVLSEKKLRRLEKNRLSARECRRRKREATEDLQRQINVLEGENLRLRLQLQIGEEAEESTQQEQDKLTESLNALLQSGASEAEIHAAIEEIKEKFADYGRNKRSASEFHLRNIERLLMPTQTTSIAMQALHGGSLQDLPMDSFPQPAAAVSPTSTASAQSSSAASVLTADTETSLAPKALFQHLVNYLDVTPEQANALKDSRLVALEMDSCLEKALGVLAELRSRMAQCCEDLDAEFNNVRSILTPTQAAKFLVWVANNRACVHMLNELWNRVYPNTPDGRDPETQSEDSP